MKKLLGWALAFAIMVSTVPAALADEGSSEPTTPTTYSVTINVNKDGAAWENHGKTITLKDASDESAAAITDLTTVSAGTYQILFGGEETGKTVAVVDTDATATLDYYSVSVQQGGNTQGNTLGFGMTYDGQNFSGTEVLGGKELVITAASSAVGNFTYTWTVNSTEQQVTGDTLTIDSIDQKTDVICTVNAATPPYKITFDANGGSFTSVYPTATDCITRSLDENYRVVDFPLSPTRDGYTFAGWKRGDDGTVATKDTMYSAPITVYAQWTLINSNSGNTSSNGSNNNGNDRDERDDRDNDRSNSSSTTTKNPDGSTTTTVTDKKNGTVTETTKNKDGSTTTIETKKDGTVTESNTDKNGTSVTTVTNQSGEVTETRVTVSETDATSSGAFLLPIDEVKNTSNSRTAQEIDVILPKGETVKVEIPVENATPGTVVIIVDADGNETILPTTQLTENGVSVTLDGSATIKIVDNSKTFNDVPEDNVFSDEIAAMSARNIMVGKSDETFDLYSEVTLNQIVNIAGRISGNVDVTDYEGGVIWGAENGLSTGDQPATRGNVLSALYLAAGAPETVDYGKLSQFSDADQIPAELLPAILWAVENGIIKGNPDGTLGLDSNVTRGQAAAFAGRALSFIA